ncbi:hypothetical protein F8S13_10445 [Chloroflexia bacterium SDU3-3]|nr:hypothetical protein F8S13_10445 [Chloroflexia bacterium SDU3-3]
MLRPWRAACLLFALIGAWAVSACQNPLAPSALIVPNLTAAPDRYKGSVVEVQGAYLNRAGTDAVGVLALGVSTQDNGLGAEPLGDPIWLEGFPEDQLRGQLHQPGDSTYGFVRVTGTFDAGGTYGPSNTYKYKISVTSAEPIERIHRTEQRVAAGSPGEGKVALAELADNPAARNGQQVITQGYYFWNGSVNILSEGISAEDDGSNPQPIGKIIWMEGFPPSISGQLHVGPGSPAAYVWGKVEVKGQFSAGTFGKDGAYSAQLQLDPNAADAAKAIQ